ncbi:hypothetical protein [Nonomuraea roseola]|uniref:Abortive infection protein n=1 Tax=Nonomuraea roseola TaxID=46179 RepID=A0ABV5Q9B1_9ACTN
MRARGINYDTGFLPDLSRKTFDPADVAREMKVIAEELRCTAVRVSGVVPERLSVAAEQAAAAGLEVWFAPFPVDLTPEEMTGLYADCADRAEAVRRAGAEVVFVTGCETSAFGRGFMSGETYMERMEAMAMADMEWWGRLGPVLERLSLFLADIVEAAVRPRFGGRVTYASGPWEFIDWTPFDLVGVDAYRAAYNAGSFAEEIRGHFEHGKPVAVTEFGTCAYTGAGQLGGMAWRPPAGAVRDEGEQARYFSELMDVFEAEGVDSAFWFTFAGYSHEGEDDLASYGVVRMPGGEPKEVFHAMAKRYR